MQPNFLTIGINDTGDALTLTTVRADPAFNFTPPDLPLAHEEANGRENAERTMGAIVLNLLETLHPDVFARYPALKAPPRDYAHLPRIDLDEL